MLQTIAMTHRKHDVRRCERDPRAGMLLVDIVIAATIFTIGVLGLVGSFTANTRASRGLVQVDDGRFAMQNAVEFLRSAPFSDIYQNYEGASLSIASFKGADGLPADVDITCYVDETALPAEFGPVLDLDGDGALLTTDVSTSYQLLPVRLTLGYESEEGKVTRELFVLIEGVDDEEEDNPDLDALIAYFQDLVDNGDKEVANRAAGVVSKLEAARDELNESPPDHDAAASKLQDAITEIERMMSEKLLDSTEGLKMISAIKSIITSFGVAENA